MSWDCNIFIPYFSPFIAEWGEYPFVSLFPDFKFFNFKLPFQASENLFFSSSQKTNYTPVTAMYNTQTPSFYSQLREEPLFSFNKNNLKTDNFTYQSEYQYQQPQRIGSLNTQMANTAKSYVGKVNSSTEGNRLFSPKGYQNTSWYKKYGRWGWCCDFAVYCAKNTLGSKYPKDMITSSPEGLATAAENNHNAYLRVPDANKESWLSNNVKKGDIIYMKGSGDSGKHIAIVDNIGSNGQIHAISGNSGGGKVREVDYNINTTKIYGFISLDRLAA